MYKIKFLTWTGKPEIELETLQYADLRDADLRDADLRDADLRDADLRGANLRYANLRYANLRYANLRYANLQGADLQGANLQDANLQGAKLPSPQQVLSANWGELSDLLTADLMEYDASSHPDRAAFDRWVETGVCPYENCQVRRAANFREKKELWGKGKLDTPYNLMIRVLKEKTKNE